MSEPIFVIIINGSLYRKDSAIRSYKTRKRAEKESQWFIQNGRRVEIGELSVVNIEEIAEGETE